ncbi:hypothetical protein, partial [Escherichia coli]|uniref:hypothetical protein n=1 Tax=Escherichia coli TaxID=562 RepID=UPI00321C2DA2
MMLESLSEGDVPKAVPAAALDMAPRPAPVIPELPLDGTARLFRIELPKIAERDVDALFAELGLLGQASKETAPDGHAIFTLVGS